ncbi:MAG: Rieske (2Fe-2S) protein [Planctomycetota bacterium]|nr:MAG: Rieske (2Fe-2S) protein [Planctomycetota bacterium]
MRRTPVGTRTWGDDRFAIRRHRVCPLARPPNPITMHRNTAPERRPDAQASAAALCTLEELARRRLLRVTCGSEDIVVCLVDDVPRAYRNRCPHQAVPLHNGAVHEALITCKAHGWRFNLITGQSPEHPAYRLQPLPVVSRAGRLYLDLETWETSKRLPRHRYLARYGRLGWVAVFGADTKWEAHFRRRVVVETARGREVAELLGPYQTTPSDPVRGPGGAPSVPADPQPAGRVLSAVTDDQWHRFEAIQRRRLVEALPHIERVCHERDCEVVVADAELLWDERNLVVYFLGEPTAKLGPVSVRLSRDLSLAVQFQPIADPPPKSGCGSCGCSTGGCSASLRGDAGSVGVLSGNASRKGDDRA